jgi:hypothetical protein
MSRGGHQGEILLNKRLGSMLSFIQQRQQQLSPGEAKR